MTPEECRSNYLDSVFSLDEVSYLKQIGLAQLYIQGKLNIDYIYAQLKEQGI